LIVETRGLGRPFGYRRTLPAVDGCVTVRFTDTAIAVDGTSHCPAMVKVRAALAARAGPPYGHGSGALVPASPQ
jgi:hypothetical protein